MHFIGALLFLYLVRVSGATETLTDAVISNAVSEWFADKASATTKYGGIGDWDVSRVTSMESLFGYTQNSFNEDIGDWDTARVTDMSRMFEGERDFNGDIGRWDTARVTDMSGMFFYAKRFNKHIGDWDTARLATMGMMFYEASAFNQYVGNWDTASVLALTSAFFRASAFNQYLFGVHESLHSHPIPHCHGHDCFAPHRYVGHWDTASVQVMSSMFFNASAFDQELGWCQSGIDQNPLLPPFMGTECQSDNCGVTFAESCPTAEPVECCSCKKGKNKKAAKKNAKKKKKKKPKGKNK